MELLLTITLSDRLFGLLEDKLPNLGRRVEKALTKELGRQVREQSEITVTASPTKAEAIEAAQKVPETTTNAPDAAQQTEPQPKKPRNLPEEIRKIMHRTRQRFEGEDYKENTDSAGYKKYHRALTSQFKQIAILLGFEKPSMINVADKVDAFSAECDALILDENGLVSPPPAPY